MNDVMLRSVELTGKVVQLRPLVKEHLKEIAQIGLEPELWKWTPTQIKNLSEMEKYVDSALMDQERGKALPFVIYHLPSKQVVGSTRFGNINLKDRVVEIGWTWVTPSFQRTAVNTEAKFLLLQYGFEVLKLNRIEFKTDFLNQKSRAAILRLGAKEEGIFRKHIITESGRIRDSVYYSLIDDEWSQVKKNLLAKLDCSKL